MSTHQTSQVGFRFREEIKAKTYEQHMRLEQHLNVLGPDKTLADYVHLLHLFYGFYHPLERQLRRWQDNPELRPLDLHTRLIKAEALQEDLAILRVQHPDEFSDLPECTQLPSLRSVPEVMGCLYVVEGSTLGGRIITRRLQEAYQITPGTGGRFFASYGSEVPSMWRQFWRVLTAYVDANPETADTILASAQCTFRTLEDYVVRQSSSPPLFPASPGHNTSGATS